MAVEELQSLKRLILGGGKMPVVAVFAFVHQETFIGYHTSAPLKLFDGAELQWIDIKAFACLLPAKVPLAV